MQLILQCEFNQENMVTYTNVYTGVMTWFLIGGKVLGPPELATDSEHAEPTPVEKGFESMFPYVKCKQLLVSGSINSMSCFCVTGGRTQQYDLSMLIQPE